MSRSAVDLTNSVYVDEPFNKDVDYYSATVNWDLGWADFVSATAYSDTSSVVRQDTTMIYGEFANLAFSACLRWEVPTSISAWT